MLESVVELLGGLFLGALILLVGSCIVGSIVAPYEPSAVEAKKTKLEEPTVLLTGAAFSLRLVYTD